MQENGSAVEFTENSSHTYNAVARVQATLVFDDSANEWTFVRAALDTFTFSEDGTLASLSDRNGYALNYCFATPRTARRGPTLERRLDPPSLRKKQRPRPMDETVALFGSEGGTRTRDTTIMSRVL